MSCGWGPARGGWGIGSRAWPSSSFALSDPGLGFPVDVHEERAIRCAFLDELTEHRDELLGINDAMHALIIGLHRV